MTLSIGVCEVTSIGIPETAALDHETFLVVSRSRHSMGRYGNLDYPTLTRRSFLLGVSLLLVGLLGETLLPVVAGPLPAWEHTLFFDLEVLGILVGLFAPLTFGVVLPLTE